MTGTPAFVVVPQPLRVPPPPVSQKRPTLH